MDEAMKAMLADLVKANKDLSEKVGTLFAKPDSEAKQKETELMVKSVMEQLAKGGISPRDQRRMVWASQGKEEETGETKSVRFSRFIRAALQGDNEFLGRFKAATGQSVGTPADGGYAVPEEYANQIIKHEQQSGLIYGLATNFPMGAPIRNVPRELADPEVYAVDEATAPSGHSKGTIEPLVQTAKKLLVNVPFTKEILFDNNVNYDSFIADRVGRAIARREDRSEFVGSVSVTGDIFDGVMFATGVNDVVANSDASLTLDDLVNIELALNPEYRPRGKWVVSLSALKIISKLKDKNDNPIWTRAIEGKPGTILGYPYVESSQIPDTLGTGRTNGTKSGILFGDWSQFWVSPYMDYTVESSNSASDAAGNSAWMKDEIWTKFSKRGALTVAQPKAFARLLFPASIAG